MSAALDGAILAETLPKRGLRLLDDLAVLDRLSEKGIRSSVLKGGSARVLSWAAFRLAPTPRQSSLQLGCTAVLAGDVFGPAR